METLVDWANNLYAVLLVVLGIGFVIFIHELGHFLFAKWAGVKVEAFAIGFLRPLIAYRKGIGFRWGSTSKEYQALLNAEKEGIQTRDLSEIGETEYSIRALPLGGFVSMLGEEPGEESQKITDPRAYRNKPVGWRMLIISAGVVMNLIFGLLANTWVYLRGPIEQPAVVGAVLAGQPAYEAGIRPRDEIVSIDGRTNVEFKDLMQTVMLSGKGQKVHLVIKRPGHSEPINLAIEPKRAANAEAPTIGIRPASSLEVRTPAPWEQKENLDELDRVIAVAPVSGTLTPVSDAFSLLELLAKARDQTVVVQIEHQDKEDGPKSILEKTLAPTPFLDFGLRMTPGPIVSIQPDSPAEKAGFRAGDLIVKINGQGDFDPMHLPDLASENAGKPMTFEVKRKAQGQTREEQVTLKATPDSSPPWIEPHDSAEPLDVNGLGFGIIVKPIIAAVAPGSPGAKAGLKPGDVVDSFSREESRDKNGNISWEKPYMLNDKVASWPGMFDVIQDLPKGKLVRLMLVSSRIVEIAPSPSEGWFEPSHGLRLGALQRKLPPQPLGVSLSRGWRDTKDMALSIFTTVRGLSQGRLGANAVGGPPNIVKWAFKTAKSYGLSGFIPFLGMISINLAVINFLPIPPLDGGQMAFLIAEKVRGRPLPENAILWPTLAGLTLVLILFVGVMLKDVIFWIL